MNRRWRGPTCASECPRRSRARRRRVGLTPDSVREVTDRGHEVYVECGAGDGAGFDDDEYKDRGAIMVPTADELFEVAELIVKVKEPQAEERARLRADHTLFTYLHLAPDPAQAGDLLASGATAIAYESVTDRRGRLPLLAPMSQVAGRLAIQGPAPAAWRHPRAAGECCWAVFPAWPPPR